MPLIRRYDVNVHKTLNLPATLVPIFSALPDIGEVVGRVQLARQYMYPLESKTFPYSIGVGKSTSTFELWARPTWKRLPSDPGNRVVVTAHIVGFWKDYDSKWEDQPFIRLTDTLARNRIESIERLLHRGC